MMKDMIIIGGDKRQKYLEQILICKGYECIHINTSEKRDLLKEVKKIQ